MSLNQTRTIQVFDKTCTCTSTPLMSLTKPLFPAPRQPTSDAKKFPFDHKNINPLLMG